VLVSDEIGTGRIYVRYGDIITVSYEDDFPADFGVTGESKTFTATARVGIVVEYPAEIHSDEITYVDVSGEPITELTAGTPMAFNVPIHNIGYEDISFAAFMVITKEGVPVYVTFATGTVPAQSSTTIGLGWSPMESGTYHVKIVVWKSLADKTPLMEETVEFDVTVS